MNISDHISESLETIFWVRIPKFFDADADPGFRKLFDPGHGIRVEKNSDPGCLQVCSSKGRDLDLLNLRSSVADPDPGSGAFLTPGAGIRDG